MIQTRSLASIGIALAIAALLPASILQAQNSASTASAHRETLQLYCIGCHSGPTPFAGLNLEPLDFANLEANGAIWEKLIRKLRGRQMPPAGMPRPDEATYEALVKYIETARDRVAEVKPNPGRITLHRLNRTEYANAIRDLLALEIDVSALLPADDIGYGFDNIGDVLSVSPLLMERYLAAASKISRTAVGDTTTPVSYQTYTVPHALIQTDRMSESLPVGSRGGTAVRHRFPVDGEYEISVGLQKGKTDEDLGLGKERKLDLRLDDERLGLFTIAANVNATVTGRANSAALNAAKLSRGAEPDAHLKVRVPVRAGTRELAATFLRDTSIVEGIIEPVREDLVTT
jgi:mono/diheme cytochrome c family protein